MRGKRHVAPIATWRHTCLMPPAQQFASARFVGRLPPGLPEDLAAAGIAATVRGGASIFITAGSAAIATAREFAEAVPHGQDALVVTLLVGTSPDPAKAAQQWAFIRQAALDWAPRRIRINAVGVGTDPLLPRQPARAANHTDLQPIPTADIAATIRLMWNLPSMTGQLIRLGRP
jgi:NAD(P)-dependent dehydrogenase (short-subunit alcohol dehydrogenase family)